MKALAVTLTAIFQWFIAFAVGLIFLALEARATPIQWSVQDGGNDHYYDLVGNHDTNQIWSWQDSKVLAEDSTYLGMTGHLVTINGAAENQFIINTFYSNYTLPMWLGLTDSPDYGGSNPIGQPNPLADGWVWVTGEPVTFTGWGSAGTGDTYGYGSYFVAIGAPLDSHPTWGAFQSGNAGSAAFLVEFQPTPTPEPSTAILLGVGAGIFLTISIRRRLLQVYRGARHQHQLGY